MYAEAQILGRTLKSQEAKINEAHEKTSKVEAERAKLEADLTNRIKAFVDELQEKQAQLDASGHDLVKTKTDLQKEQEARDAEAKKLTNVLSDSLSKKDELAEAKKRLAALDVADIAARARIATEEEAIRRLQDSVDDARTKEKELQESLKEALQSKNMELKASQRERDALIGDYEERLRRELSERLKEIAKRFPGDALKYKNYQGEDQERAEKGFEGDKRFLNDAMGLQVNERDQCIMRRGLSSVADSGFTVDVFGSEDNSRIYVGAKFLGSGKTGACVVENLNDRSQQLVMKKYAIAACVADSDLRKELWAAEIPPHENIVRYERAVITRFTGYVLMEKVPGVDWLVYAQNLSQSKTVLPENDAREAFRQLMLATKHLHDNNVLHLDIKPENVMIDDTGPSPRVKLIDLGLAHYLRRSGGGALTFTDGSCQPPSNPGGTAEEQGHYDDVYRCVASLWIVLAQTYPPYDKYNPNIQHLSEDCHDLLKMVLQKKGGTSCDRVFAHRWMKGSDPQDPGGGGPAAKGRSC